MLFCGQEAGTSAGTKSCSDQQHYASDAGKSKEEIEKITEPSRELTFEASGVLIKGYPKCIHFPIFSIF